MEFFLLDIYDTHSLSDISSLNRIIDKEKRVLRYNQVYKDNFIHASLSFSRVWKHLFGIVPSKIDVYNFMKFYNTDKSNDVISTMLCYMEKNTFYGFVKHVYSSHIENIVKLTKQYLVDLERSHEFVKAEILDKLCERYLVSKREVKNVSLYEQYVSIIGDLNVGSYFSKQEKFIERNKLCFMNPIINTTFNALSNIDLFKGTISIVDCIRFLMLNDRFLLRNLFMKNLIVCFEDESPVMKYVPYFVNALNNIDQTNILYLGKKPSIQNVRFLNLSWVSKLGANIINVLPKIFQTVIIFDPPSYVCFQNVCFEDRTILFYSIKNHIIFKTSCLPKICVYNNESYDLDSIKNVCIIDGRNDTFLSRTEFVASLLSKYIHGFGKGTIMHSHLYVLNHLIKECMKQNVEPSLLETNPNAKNAVILIDGRSNVLSILSCVITLMNIDRKRWNLCIFTSSSAIKFYESFFHHTIQVIHEPSLDKFPFDIEDYNTLLKSEQLWGQLQAYDNVLTIQDDGMLIRPGVERFIGLYDYIGAPWALHPCNEMLKVIGNPQQIGNGGLSLRNPKLILEIIKNTSEDPIQLFNQDLQPIPEDVFFANKVYNAGGRIPSREEAMKFSIEQVFDSQALGFHKIWSYLSYEQITMFLHKE